MAVGGLGGHTESTDNPGGRGGDGGGRSRNKKAKKTNKSFNWSNAFGNFMKGLKVGGPVAGLGYGIYGGLQQTKQKKGTNNSFASGAIRGYMSGGVPGAMRGVVNSGIDTALRGDFKGSANNLSTNSRGDFSGRGGDNKVSKKSKDWWKLAAGAGAAYLGYGAYNNTGIGGDIRSGVNSYLNNSSNYNSYTGQGGGGPASQGGGSGTDWGSLIMGGIDAYGNYKQGKQQQDDYRNAFQTANPFAQYRGQFGAQLSNFMQDPNSITQTPGYKFALEQGEKSIGRTAAATGGRLGGKRLYDVQKFGQGLASQMRQQEITNLSMLSGATMGFGGGQYGANAGGKYWEGINSGLSSMGTAFGYGNRSDYPIRQGY